MDFSDLIPDFICDAVETQGYRPSGQIFQLNSYENRVYEVCLENKAPLIAKFYRPKRWSEECLIDEHRALKELQENEIPVVRPLVLENPTGFESLAKMSGYHYCLYPKFGGHEEADLQSEHRQWLGRLLARMHNVLERLPLQHRVVLNSKSYGDASLDLMFEQDFLPDDLRSHVEDIAESCLDLIDPVLNQNWNVFTVHGDCHLGNVLWNQDGPTLVDFDDMVQAPVVQDIWMLFHGSQKEQKKQREEFFEGYHTFRDFDERELILQEPLRTLRMIRHTAWIGERFEEAIFQRAFPYYTERKYWEDFLLSLKEQLALLQGHEKFSDSL